MRLTAYAQEQPNTCAIACLRMVAEHYGVTVSEPQLASLCGTTADGTTPTELVSGARKIGLSAAVAYGDMPLLQTAISQQQPVIVFLGIMGSPPSSSLSIHAVAVSDLDGERVTVIDPADGLVRTCDRASFLADWGRASSIAILVSPV